jgi:tRNA threonylcarbamoyladenosine biosynthesis protein TsaB
VNILGIETSGNLGGFSVAGENGCLAEEAGDVTGRHLESATGMIEAVLAESGIGMGDLRGVAVSLGPGSFTGLRVGMSLAKGLCLALEIPLAGVPSLDSMAENLEPGEGLVVPVRDARRGEIYFSVYESGREGPKRIEDYRALRPEALVEHVNRLAGGRPVRLAGDALAVYGRELVQGLTGPVTAAPAEVWPSRPGTIARLGRELVRRGRVMDLDVAEPLYVRPSEAERRGGRT